MSDQLSNDVMKIVDDIFKKKEESEMIRETEIALQNSADTINELNGSLEAKDAELVDKEAEVLGLSESITTFNTKIEGLENDKTSLEKEKVDLENEKADIVKRAEGAELKVAEMEKDELAKVRFNELKESGIAATNDEATKDQISKVREMSDEDFLSYKNELVAIREAIVEELKSPESENAGDDEDAGSGEDNGDDGGDEDDEDAAASDSASISMMHSVAAALNMEVMPNEDMVTKYMELGSQMAENIKTKKGKSDK